MRWGLAVSLILLAGCSTGEDRPRQPEVPRDGRGDALLSEIRPPDGAPAPRARKQPGCLHLRRC
jgi:hypothetical protein